MTLISTYPKASQATAWLRCADMFPRLAKVAALAKTDLGGRGIEATYSHPSFQELNRNREASS
jgi:hypothetical protein